MTAAAFQATYSDFKLIKTRGVVSISFEVPVEQAQTVLDVLGGMPVAASEVWCGIARMTNAKEVMPPVRHIDPSNTPETSPRQEPSTPDGAKTDFRDMRLPKQAGRLCKEIPFIRFMNKQHPVLMASADNDVAQAVRNHCKVASRSDIRPRTPSGDRWQRLFEEYQVWMHAPELCA